ncbi:MAG: hypothetical protein MUC60_09460 [Oscillatoria sp. Prado101]|nr:hypothetical protein [Oscillatoria sp. Prado101]
MPYGHESVGAAINVRFLSGYCYIAVRSQCADMLDMNSRRRYGVALTRRCANAEPQDIWDRRDACPTS